jgi:hypothetical protein
VQQQHGIGHHPYIQRSERSDVVELRGPAGALLQLLVHHPARRLPALHFLQEPVRPASQVCEEIPCPLAAGQLRCARTGACTVHDVRSSKRGGVMTYAYERLIDTREREIVS